MKKRLVFYISIIVTLSLFLMFGLGLLVTKSINNEMTSKNLIEITQIYASIYNGDNSVIKEIDTDIRVTVISSSGIVVMDTSKIDVSTLENHLQREEVQSALKNQPKTVSRFSETLGRNMMYYAEKVEVGSDYFFIRTATPTESVSAYLVKTIPLTLLILFCVLCLSILFSILICDRFVKPYAKVKDSLQAINNGTYTKIMPVANYPEVNEVLSEINDIAEKINSNLDETNEEKTKLDYIISNINDGIIAIDSEKRIRIINKKASEIFGATTNLIGASIESLTANAQLISTFVECVDAHKNSVFELNVEKSVYLVTVKRLSSWKQENDFLAVAILSDITESKNGEKLRGEFFANASHELKTPLTAIKGFNELVELSNTDKNLEKPIAQISKEADRMLALIEDMLKLSRLETSQKVELISVSLRSVTEEVFDSLAPLIKNKKLTVNVDGEAEIQAQQQHIYELVKNLAENAVKYNVDNGKVNVKIENNEKAVSYEISDTGIGIGSKYQSRIFERFYRVEKSRSRATGGTGLGLSIVKHVCLLYNAEIKLNSKIGVGTTITVTFPK